MLYGIYGKVNPGSIPGSVYHFPLLIVTKQKESMPEPTDQEKLDKIFEALEKAEQHYNEGKHGSMLRSVHEAKQKLRRYQESKKG